MGREESCYRKGTPKSSELGWRITVTVTTQTSRQGTVGVNTQNFFSQTMICSIARVQLEAWGQGSPLKQSINVSPRKHSIVEKEKNRSGGRKWRISSTLALLSFTYRGIPLRGAAKMPPFHWGHPLWEASCSPSPLYWPHCAVPLLESSLVWPGHEQRHYLVNRCFPSTWHKVCKWMFVDWASI